MGNLATYDYRDILRRELLQRCNRSPKYSQRSFAKFLGLSSSRLNEVLHGKKGLSHLAAVQITRRLGFSASESAHFCDLVDSVHARSAQVRQLAQARLERNTDHVARTILSEDTFKVVADWHHLALLELLRLPREDARPESLAKRLGIHSSTVKDALERLRRLDLVVETKGKWRPKAETSVLGDTSSAAIANFHKQVIDKALASLTFQPAEKTEFSSTIMTIKDDQLPLAKAMIKQFWKNFCQAIDTTPGHNDLYCLTVQFFSLLSRDGP